MKTISTILTGIALAFTLTIQSGCVTGSGAATQLQQLASLARVASFVGASEYLAFNPEATPKFEQARTAVDSLLLSDTIDPLALREALAMLPIDELRGQRAAVWIGAAQLLFEGVNGQTTPVQTPKEVKAFATAIRDGLGLALGGTAAPAAPTQ